MAPSSRPWTSGSGDGTSAYTAAQWASMQAKTFTDGVLRGIGGELAVSGAATPLSVAAGAGYVDGIFFDDPAATSLTVSTPAATTGGCVVLRADWAARTARLVVKLSASGVVTPPAATQTSGTTYEIILATFTVTNAGVITLTDARPFVTFASNHVKRTGDTMLANLIFQAPTDQNVVTGVLFRTAAAVQKWIAGHNQAGGDFQIYDYTLGRIALKLLGNVINGPLGSLPQLSHRVGGSASDWWLPGVTAYTPAATRMQTGVTAAAAISGGSLATQAVTFAVTFTEPPFVLAVSTDRFVAVAPTAVTVSGFTASLRADSSLGGASVTPWINWLAIGPA